MLKFKLNFKNSFFLLLTLTAVLFFSCESKKKQEKKAVIKKSIVDTFPKDSIAFNKHGFYPVYRISEKITALVYPIGFYKEENLFFNKIYNETVTEDTIAYYNDELRVFEPKNATVIDTSGKLKIYWQKNLERKMNEFTKKSFYLIGTKGSCQITTSKIYCSSSVEGCLSDIIALQIDKYDEKLIGEPLFCSEKPIELTFNGNYNKQKANILKFKKALNLSYQNPVGVETVFANYRNYYFVYEDNFNWYKPYGQGDFDFPTRSIYKIEPNGKVRLVYEKLLDLFGTPCD